LRLFNTRTHRVEPFAPLRDNHIRMYVCGLTPSAEAHLGHARSFMFFDALRRYLVHLGYRVTFVQNVTDIDDRSIAAALASGKDWKAIVEGYFQSFKRSMTRLHVLEPDHEPRATAYVPQIVEMIGRLVESGHAYAVGDGVYFRVKSFARYGALSGRNVDELMIGARIAPDEHKEDPLDFALWKLAKPGEPSWPSPWGGGRPGWHIECSAMSHELLGEPFDIHGGGYDLVFPHHENEIAQSESLLPKPPMANFWMHGGLLQFDNRKMSKSLGNFEPLYQLLDRHDPQAIRLLFLQTGYRKPMNFTEESIEGATTGLQRLLAAYDALREAPPGVRRSGSASESLEKYVAFHSALKDDMNTSGAVSVLFEVANRAGEFKENGEAAAASAFMHEAMSLLGISPSERAHRPVAAPTVTRTVAIDAALTASAGSATSVGASATILQIDGPADAAERLPLNTVEQLRNNLGPLVELGGDPVDAVAEVIAARQRAKGAKDFGLADRFRDALKDLGIVLTDVKGYHVSWTVVGG
jgi:cysteinyl-tRNA synthetase